jgi:uncharacterized membrane protein YraQ (UPF0718 family)
MTDRAVARRPDDEDVLPPYDWAPGRSPNPRLRAVWMLGVIVAVLVLGRLYLAPHVQIRVLQAWSTVFLAICVQALPFLIFGVALSAAITAFVPPAFWARALPRRPAAAVPVAGAAGAVLPGCECASVPVAGGLMARGVAPAAALAFLLAAPAINPVVLVATAVAFPGRPEIVVARFVASLAVSILAGWAWVAFGRTEWLRIPSRPRAGQTGKWDSFQQTMRHDLIHTGGFLVVGAAAAATLNVAVPPGWVSGLAGIPGLSVLVLAVLAVLLSICSEADAFVASSLTQFSPTAKLAFMVVGPMVDLKLIALQSATFGRGFAVRFIPLTFALAVGGSALAGWVLL